MTAAHYLVEAVFWIFMVTTVMGGLLAVKARVLMHIVLGLALAFLGVAGLYAYLGSMFLAVMQILIYLGAICIVLVFGIMVGYTPRQMVEGKIRGENLLLAVPACVAAFVLLRIAISKSEWTPALERSTDYSLESVGMMLLNEYSLAFELVSVLLLVAMVGAIIVAMGRKGDRDVE